MKQHREKLIRTLYIWALKWPSIAGRVLLTGVSSPHTGTRCSRASYALFSRRCRRASLPQLRAWKSPSRQLMLATYSLPAESILIGIGRGISSARLLPTPPCQCHLGHFLPPTVLDLENSPVWARIAIQRQSKEHGRVIHGSLISVGHAWPNRMTSYHVIWNILL